MYDFSLDHVRGLSGCSHFRMLGGRQPGGPILEEGFEKVELVTGGRCWAQDGSREVEATAGTLIWHLPGDRLISRSDESDPYSCLVVTWIIDQLIERRVPRFTRWDDRSEVLAYGRRLLIANSDERIDRRALALATYGHLQFHAHAWEATADDPAMPPQLRSVTDAVSRDPAASWSVSSMAKRAGWSPSRLHAAFQQYLGTSPHQYVLDLRLRLARELLATTTLDLDHIAKQCGLGSAAVLCRRFRKHSGMTPGTYRDRQFT